MRVQAMGGRKKQAGRSGENNERPELKFEANDLMELEFGRLLGEPRQATLAKVSPNASDTSLFFIAQHTFVILTNHRLVLRR